jgi:RES domain
VSLTRPPALYDGTPNRYSLRRGTCLWRVHKHEYSARAFKAVPSDLFEGARFDSTDADPYPYWYAALDETTALAEVLLRELPYDERGTRALTHVALAGRQISGLTLTRDLELVSLIAEVDLAAVAQDQWLVSATGHEYAFTREWAHWLRSQAPWAHGFIWSSRRDRGRLAIILFGDRCAMTFGTAYEREVLHEIPELAVDLDDKAGAEWLNGLLAPYRVVIEGQEKLVPGKWR